VADPAPSPGPSSSTGAGAGSFLILAVRFLTIVPIPGREASGPHALGSAAWWFPVVGLALGGALVLLDRLLAVLFPPLLSALLVVSLWKVATGGIHLDGLADCLDAIGGRDREHRLAIMRDSRIGVFGAVGLILLFLIALVTLAELSKPVRGSALLLAPVVGRLAPLVVGPWFPAASPQQGYGSPFLASLSAWSGGTHLAWTAALAVALLGPWGALALAATLAAVLLWSAFMTWRLGGLTGDVLGSGVELAELGILLGAAALAHAQVL
jgi:adenosylcobinamide-GDP ribazoletransferase